MANEAVTEDLTSDVLRGLGYYEDSRLRVERQQTKVAPVSRLLKLASKTGGTGAGYPDFIITSPDNPDWVIVIEAKAERRYHESVDRTRVADYAVDGVLHYASFLAKDFNVVAVAVSGETKDEFAVSSFVQAKGSLEAKNLTARSGSALDSLVKFDDYIDAAEFSPEVERLREFELMEFARELHDFLWKHAKLTEEQKPLLVSGTLIALMDRAFAESFGSYTPSKLQKRWGEVVREQIDEADIPRAKKNNIYQPYSGIVVHPQLSKGTKDFPKGVLNEVISRISEKVWPFIAVYHAHDIVGKFYGEFLKYTGGDKKALGIVLTPRHVTELFALLANLSPTDRVVDPCAGTGGFLISAMDLMLRKSKTHEERETIKKSNLIGVENQPHMYALAASNMILRGDGKANLYQGSCFDDPVQKEIKARKPNVGLINPPYAQGESDLHELAFVDNMLDMLIPGAMGIAIVPLSCVTAPNKYKEILLKKHTLEAVMSMPVELFSPVGTITCIVVLTAHKPHEVSDRKTWFGFWREDGFVKTKHKGRIDQDQRWPLIRDSWVQAFRNREVVPGHSVSKQVTAGDEWLAEAYLETNYDEITQSDFEAVVREYAVFSLLHASAGMTE
uniref:HsdM family class I SAM-dependent methyltransferase n=1 Tax=Arthrobacter sp. TaxID=1667 RepID=UPI000EB752EC|nr:N-6 DNA methylase [Arthrobacter sp.]AXV46719.1 type I restriction-modification protein subunit M [Arthrobacter sp.]